MDDKERHQRGMTRRRKILGDAWVDRAESNSTRSVHRHDTLASCRLHDLPTQ